MRQVEDNTMTAGTLIYEGKAKKIFTTGDSDQVLQYFKDDATAFNAQKRGTIVGKGIINNRVSERLFRFLEQNGVPTHFVERKSDREMLTKRVTIVPVEVVVRNVVAGSLAKRLGLKEGDPIQPAIVEWYYKNDALGDPLITDEHVRLMKLATPEYLAEIRRLALKVNSLLQPFFAERKMILVDFKMEFGLHSGKLILADEISPDTCRFWDQATKESMDKDRFRKDLGKIEEAYQEVLKRVCG
jgi:phosphoribosylaminoimidazole-succinocarboxamide synthase